MVNMERHKCKLCSRRFSSGRALGGHMRSHLATLPLPPKAPQKQEEFCTTEEFVVQVGGGGGGHETTESTSSECFEEDIIEEEVKLGAESEDKGVVYGLRENPKKSFRLVDPEFLDAGSVVQDRESETESTRKPTRRRSKRTRRMLVTKVDDDVEQKLIKPSATESLVELEPVSSVSDTSPEEDLALCLIMLSRDVWSTNSNESEVLKLSQNRRKLQCEICNKIFTSSQALGGHRTTHKKIKNCPEENEGESRQPTNSNVVIKNIAADKKVHECPFCGKVFGSGQALGGHKRSHLLSSSTTTPSCSTKLGHSLVDSNSAKIQEGLMIDLNLPAPMEDEVEVEGFCLQEAASAISDAVFINPIKH